MRIIVATDGSPAAQLGIEQATALARASGGEIRIVAVVPPETELLGDDWTTDRPGDRTPAQIAARSMLAFHVHQALGRLPPDLAASTALLEGRPADAIVVEAVRWGADLVVVGARGHGALESILLGSVSEEIVDRCPVPTLVARRPSVERLVIAVDGSPASASSVALVGSGAFRGRRAWVVDVAPSSHPWWLGMAAADEANLERLAEVQEVAAEHDRRAAETAAAVLRTAGLVANSCHRVGDAARELIGAAAEVDADLIVIGSRRRSGLSRVLMGSVARKVLRHADASVLVVHPAVRSSERPLDGATDGRSLVSAGR